MVYRKLEERDDRIQKIRETVLEALDSAAKELYGLDDFGWKDPELPELFRAIDAQANRVAIRAFKR